MPARLTSTGGWMLCSLLGLAGLASFVLYFKQRENLTTHEQLLVLEGRPAILEVKTSSGREYMVFEIEGRRISYSSDDPEYSTVLAALESGDVLTMGVSPFPENIRRAGDKLTLYQLDWRKRRVLQYDQMAVVQAKSSLAIAGIGGFLILLAGLGAWGGLRNDRRVRAGLLHEEERDPVSHARKARRFVTVVVSILFYLVLLGVHLDPKIRAKDVEAFGAELGGIPIVFVVMFVETLLYLPIPYFFWHLARITIQARYDGRMLTLGYILSAPRTHPELRVSRAACIGGVIYFATIAGAWIVYTSRLGI